MFVKTKRSLLYGLSLVLALVLLAACAAAEVAVDPPTPTPEVFIPRTAVVPAGPTIAGRVLWGMAPVAGVRVELRTGAWADPAASEAIASTVTDAGGAFALEAPPAGGEFGLVALWPDGGVNTAPVTPVQVAAGTQWVEADVRLARQPELAEPASGAEVSATPTLRWGETPGVAQYRLFVIDAGTTELAFDLAITENVAGEQTVVLPPLTPGRTYHWEVQGLDAGDNLLARLTGEFTVLAPRGHS